MHLHCFPWFAYCIVSFCPPVSLMPGLPAMSMVIFTEFVAPSLFDPFTHGFLMTWHPSSSPSLGPLFLPIPAHDCFALGGSYVLNGSQGPHKHRAAWTVHLGRGSVTEYDCIQTQGQSGWQFSRITAFPVCGWAHHEGLSGMSLVQYPCFLVYCNFRCICSFLLDAN